ncbi:MAG TPA: hypothetical protein VFL60_10450 [Gaiellaceae bacterium]|nr:hypothetical protein [Gaiellaceae bacterium]
MKRMLLPLVCALAAAGSAAAALPVHQSGSSVGEGVPLKAYASITPTVHLFGDLLTARLAIVADTKWVEADRLRVHASFTPYQPVHPAQVLRLASGRFEQITYTWSLRCIASPCVPRTPPSDRYHVFRFPPARIDYVSAKGRPAYGIDTYWPPVEVLSQVSPGVAAFLFRTRHIDWRVHLTPMAAPTYRISPTLLLWLAAAVAGLFGALALFLVVRWYRGLRPEPVAETAVPASQLERALAVLRYAHESGDETLQRKALERVAGELGAERAAELTLVARELAWSARTPADEEVESFASQAGDAGEDEP